MCASRLLFHLMFYSQPSCVSRKHITLILIFNLCVFFFFLKDITMTDTQWNATNNKRIYFEGTDQLSHWRYLAGTADREWKLHDHSHRPLRTASQRKHGVSWIKSEMKLVFLFWGDPSRVWTPALFAADVWAWRGEGGAGTTTLCCPPSPPIPSLLLDRTARFSGPIKDDNTRPIRCVQ